MFVLGLLIFCLKVKFLLDYTDSISPNKYEKDDKTILKHFQQQKSSFVNRFQRGQDEKDLLY